MTCWHLLYNQVDQFVLDHDGLADLAFLLRKECGDLFIGQDVLHNGINYLLNVGPDGLGRIPSFSQEVLRKSAR